MHKGNVIKQGVNTELDDLRSIQNSGKEYLDEMLEREIERTGITSLKISFNNVFGYYLEVRNRFKDQVPEQWIRKQTLVSAERYITEELKEYEHKILSAEGKISEIEARLFADLVEAISVHIEAIQLDAFVVSQLDCLLSFASIAKAYQGDVLAIILTGMGADGRDGARMLKQTGATIWAQDEKSCVVYGMPQAVANAGLSSESLALDDIATRIKSETGCG
jgi:hypothetical protein